jgi:hypothetical protein
MEMVFIRVLSLLGLLVLLQACVLQSEKPLFAEEEAKPLLEKFGTTFTSSTFKDGEWTVEDDPVTFVARGRGYIVKENGKDGVTHVLFVPQKDGWWVMQATEEGKSAAYLLAHPEGKALYLYALFCDDLKKNAKLAAWITYKDDNCSLDPNRGPGGARAIFTQLPLPPKDRAIKLEPRP